MEDKVLKIMRSVFEQENIDNNCSQENCENWDSLRHLALISELEDVFDIEFEPEEINDMNNFRQVIRLLNEKSEVK